MKKILSMLVMLFIIGAVNINAQSEKEKLPPPPPAPKEIPKVDITKFKPPASNETIRSNNAFFKRNPTVANVWLDGTKTLIKLKSGKREEYNLTNEAERKSFVEKYGEPPVNPPRVIEIRKSKPPLPPPPPRPKEVI